MPNVGPMEMIIVLLYVAVVVAVIALPVYVLREMRRRGEQLDRIERRLEEADRRSGVDHR